MNSEKNTGLPVPGPRFFYGYIIVLVALIIIVGSFSIRYSFGVFFKPMLAEFGWTRAATSGAFTLSWLIQGLLGVAAGWLSDKFSPRLVLSFCGVFVGLGCILMSQMSAVWQLYLFYGVIFGIGMSGVWSPILSTLARWFVARRGMMTGIVLAGTGAGAMVAGPMANWLISSYGWRDSLIIMGGLVFVIIVLVSQFLRRDPFSMGQEPYGYTNNSKGNNNKANTGFSLRNAIATHHFWLLAGMTFCYGYCAFTGIVHIVPHATDIGISADNAANILAVWGALQIIGRIILGSVADKTGARLIYIFGFITFSIALSCLVITRELWILFILAALLGFGQGGMGACLSLLTADIFGLKSLGIIIGTVSLGFTFGAGIGPLITGHIFDINGSYDMAFVLCTVLSVIGLALTLSLKTKTAKSN